MLSAHVQKLMEIQHFHCRKLWKSQGILPYLVEFYLILPEFYLFMCHRVGSLKQ